MRAADGETLRRLALEGVGLARLSVYHIHADLLAGTLVPVMEAFNPGDTEPIHAVYLGKSGRLPARIRAVLDFLVEHVKLPPVDEDWANFKPNRPVARAARAQAAIKAGASVDAWLAADLGAEHLARKPFAPLPVLGVPGWWPGNENFSFYDDSFVFRSARPTSTTQQGRIHAA